MSTLFAFPGQGAQKPGMLQRLPDEPQIAEALSEASEVLGTDALALDTAEALASTRAVQLCLLIAGVAGARLLMRDGLEPDYVAAHDVTSLGRLRAHLKTITSAESDELSGLIQAAVLMRPSKSVMDFELKSLKKKFKDKRFAAGCSRDVISQGAEMLGWELPELFDRTIAAMQSFAPDRDTFQA